MTCREFNRKIEDLVLSDLSSNTEMLTHQNSCAPCATLLQQRHALAGAMQTLRGRTATMKATSVVEQNVLRAFRQTSAMKSEHPLRNLPQSFGSQLSHFFGWRAYAAAAAVAICLGLGLWFAPRSDKSAQSPMAKTEQPPQPSVNRAEKNTQLPVQASARHASRSNSGIETASSEQPLLAPASLTQSEQAQGYTPLMLCDPISCSGDEHIVRMELPATAGNELAGTQMADVIVGDDGLVRAIRIVQQQ